MSRGREFRFEDLHEELVVSVALFLAPVDLLRLGSTCRRTVSLLDDTHLWKRLIHRELSCERCQRTRASYGKQINSRAYGAFVATVQGQLAALTSAPLEQSMLTAFQEGCCQPVKRLLKSSATEEVDIFNAASGIQLQNNRWTFSAIKSDFKGALCLLSCRLLHWDFVTRLLELEPSLAVYSSLQGETALHYACKEGQLEVMAALLDLGANPAAPAAAYGWTPVCRAVIADQLAAFTLLREKGCVSQETLLRLMTLAAENGCATVFQALRDLCPEDEDLALQRAFITNDSRGVDFIAQFEDAFRAWRPYQIHGIFSTVVDRRLLRAICYGMSAEAAALMLSNDHRFNGCCVLIERQRWDLVEEYLSSSVVSDEELLRLAFIPFSPSSLSLLDLTRRLCCQVEAARAILAEMERRGLGSTEKTAQLRKILETGQGPSEAVLLARLQQATRRFQEVRSHSEDSDHSDDHSDYDGNNWHAYEEEEEEEPWE